MTPFVLCLLALLVDLIFADRLWFPHPVTLIGRWIRRWDRAIGRDHSPAILRCFGLVGVISTIGLTGCVTFALMTVSHRLHPMLGYGVSLLLLWLGLAGTTLINECQAVATLLSKGDLMGARKQVARLVGRDTQNLTATEVGAAAVETMAENSSDGVVAPLFWGAVGLWLGGLCWALTLLWSYKAINTMDSMVGYLSPQHCHVGFFAAKTDDVANYLPARLTAALILLVHGVSHPSQFMTCVSLTLRDGNQHLSPNAGWPEAAMAACLQVQLGGAHFYSGRWVEKPTLGEPIQPITAQTVMQSCRYLWPVTLLSSLLWAVGS